LPEAGDRKKTRTHYETREPGETGAHPKTPVPKLKCCEHRIGGGEGPATLDCRNNAPSRWQRQDKLLEVNDFAAIQDELLGQNGKPRGAFLFQSLCRRPGWNFLVTSQE